MKKRIYILLLLGLSFGFSSCKWEQREDTYGHNSYMLLSDFIQSYDLWYVNIDKTTGTGDIPFISRAFTMSFRTNGEVYANNNIVGLGRTGNGFGINTGTYTVFNSDHIISILDDVFGRVDFEVNQLSINKIALFNRANNVTYVLVGYQKFDFDFDKLFYENITYFLQEYKAWTRTGASIVDNTAPFVFENHLTFYVSGNSNVFKSSESQLNILFSKIIWDYHGTYEVYNTSVEHLKDLILHYNINNQSESFKLDILNDQNIKLTNIRNGNTYTYTGRSYIQYRSAAKRLPQHRIDITKKHYLLK